MHDRLTAARHNLVLEMIAEECAGFFLSAVAVHPARSANFKYNSVPPWIGRLLPNNKGRVSPHSRSAIVFIRQEKPPYS